MDKKSYLCHHEPDAARAEKDFRSGDVIHMSDKHLEYYDTRIYHADQAGDDRMRGVYTFLRFCQFGKYDERGRTTPVKMEIRDEDDKKVYRVSTFRTIENLTRLGKARNVFDRNPIVSESSIPVWQTKQRVCKDFEHDIRKQLEKGEITLVEANRMRENHRENRDECYTCKHRKQNELWKWNIPVPQEPPQQMTEAARAFLDKVFKLKEKNKRQL